MTVSWQKIRLPVLERLALAELAEESGESEEALLARLVREEVRGVLVAESEAERGPQEIPHDNAAN